MTGTTFDVEFIVGCYDYLSNGVISKVMLEKMKKTGGPKFTEEEKKFAHQLESKVPRDAGESSLKTYELNRDELGGILCDKVLERVGGFAKGKVVYISTEVGDVSYICPTGQCLTSCWPVGVDLHTWQSVASCGSTIGFKGMMLTAKTLALTALELIAKPDVLRAATEEFKKNTGGEKYISPLPKGLAPPVALLPPTK